MRALLVLSSYLFKGGNPGNRSTKEGMALALVVGQGKENIRWDPLGEGN